MCVLGAISARDVPRPGTGRPAASLDGEVARESEEADATNPALSDAAFDDDEKPTEPALQRTPKYVKVLVANAGCAVRVPDDEE